MKKVQSDSSLLVTTIQSKEEFYHLNYELNSKMTWIKAPDIMCLAKKGNMKHFSELINKKPLLFFRFTHKNCNPCYEAEMQNVQKVFKDHPELTNVLCSYFSRDDFFILVKQNKLITNIYSISFDAFDWIVEKYNRPYYFVLHPDMKISHIYVPNESYPELNEHYLEEVKKIISDFE